MENIVKNSNAKACIFQTTIKDSTYYILVQQERLVQSEFLFNIFEPQKIEVFSPNQHPDTYIIHILAEHFQQKGIYYSSNPLIASSDFTKDDKEFLWSSGTNYCVFGFISDNYICRRSKGYQGKRFLTRGVNSNGDASNQLLCQVIKRNSQTQKYDILAQVLRGQMPIMFQQPPNMGPKPPLEVTEHGGFEKYMQKTEHLQLKNQVFFNLVDNKKSEQKLAQQFVAEFVQFLDKQNEKFECFEIVQKENDEASQKITILDKVVNVDFTHIGLKKVQDVHEYKLGIVVVSKGMSYVHLDYHKTISKQGKGYAMDLYQLFQLIYGNFIPRINCVDSLDRTNSAIMYYFDFLKIIDVKNLVLFSGNIISQQYATSNAMKQDLAEFGKRTLKGKLQDLQVWIKRIVCNNILDGYQMDAYRIVQAEFRVEKQKQLNFSMFLTFMMIFLILLLTLISKLSDQKSIIIVAIMIWIGFVMAFIKQFGCAFAIKGML